ncbi:hypothetical protein DFH11DRAFT_1880629 [Phellopilus nigrolimitatus]|nr:hypothetical protein DFH11DRAFT_1880629 [Phellopilus nigrolimitatus]
MGFDVAATAEVAAVAVAAAAAGVVAVAAASRTCAAVVSAVCVALRSQPPAQPRVLGVGAQARLACGKPIQAELRPPSRIASPVPCAPSLSLSSAGDAHADAEELHTTQKETIGARRNTLTKAVSAALARTFTRMHSPAAATVTRQTPTAAHDIGRGRAPFTDGWRAVGSAHV